MSAEVPVPTELVLSDLSDGAVRLYLVASTTSGQKSSRAEHAETMGISIRTVHRYAKELIDTGWWSVPAEPGFIYSMAYSIDEGPFKVGRAIDPEKRRFDLQTGSPDRLWLVETWPTRDMNAAETRIHSALSEYRVSGEWFACDMATVRTAVADGGKGART